MVVRSLIPTSITRAEPNFDAGSSAVPMRRTGNGRRLLFFLSPRLIDFDTWVPVAMELARARPDWDIRFITFSREHLEMLMRNDMLIQGFTSAGRLECLDARARGKLVWPFLRLIYLLKVCWWIVSRSRPVLLFGHPYCRMPFSAWYVLSRMRGGMGVILAKSRQADENMQPASFRKLKNLPQSEISWVERMFGRDFDAYVDYHDKQDVYVSSIGRLGRIPESSSFRVGMPNFAEAWRRHVRHEADALKKSLKPSNGNEREIYAFFPAKIQAERNLRTTNSPQETFRQVIETLFKLKPDACLLVRPHPVSLKDPQFLAVLDAVKDDRIVVTDAHPEVMIAVAARIFVNAPTNIQTTSAEGRFIDCSDYPDSYYEAHGEVSRGHGYGSVFVRPDTPNFEARLKRAIDDDSLFADREISGEREQLLAKGEFNLAPLLDRLEHEFDTA